MSNASPAAQFTSFSSNDREAMEASHQVIQAINSNVNVTSAAGLDTSQICQQYQSIRPTIEKYLPYIKFIPIVGAAAYAAISGLMTLLDALCGTS